VQHDLMTDGDVFTDGQGLTYIGMENAAVLDVAATPDAYGLCVTPDDGRKPDAGILPERDTPDHLGTVSHPGAFMQLRLNAVKLIEGHVTHENKIRL
jgi:hypothetical protein